MLTLLAFADGTIREVPERLAPRVVGLDADGDLLVLLLDEEPAHPAPDGSGPYLLPLTPCCSATGKGAATGIVCRRCFDRVDEKYGAWSHLAVAVVRPVAALALELFARVKELEHSVTNLPGADVVNLLVAWFAEHGLDIALPAATYAATINVDAAAAEPHCSHDPAALRVVAMLSCECGELIDPASGGRMVTPTQLRRLFGDHAHHVPARIYVHDAAGSTGLSRRRPHETALRRRVAVRQLPP